MRHKETKIWYTCDICGEKSIPCHEIQLQKCYDETIVYQLKTTSSMKLYDICSKCLVKMLKQWIEEQEADNEQL